MKYRAALTVDVVGDVLGGEPEWRTAVLCLPDVYHNRRFKFLVQGPSQRIEQVSHIGVIAWACMGPHIEAVLTFNVIKDVMIKMY